MQKVKNFFSEEEDKIIMAFYPMTNTNFLAKTLLKRHTRRQISSKAYYLGIEKSPNYEKEIKHAFKPGNIPGNKGKYTATNPKIIRERARKRLRLKDGTVKTIGQMVWYKHHGYYPPRNCCIAYKDGNLENNAIENLEMISRAELAIRNQNKIPNFLRRLILIRANLVRSLKKHDKSNK